MEEDVYDIYLKYGIFGFREVIFFFRIIKCDLCYVKIIWNDYILYFIEYVNYERWDFFIVI